MIETSDSWHRFEAEHRDGERLKVYVASIVNDIGLFCDLPFGILGIVHLADLDWEMPEEQDIDTFKVGDELVVIVLHIQPELQRVSLGIKQTRHKPSSRRSGPSSPSSGPAVPPVPRPRPPGLSGASVSIGADGGH